jgi:hypothetical protein
MILQKELDKLSEESLRNYMACSVHTARGLPGPGSLYEHGYQEGFREAERLTAKYLEALRKLNHPEADLNPRYVQDIVEGVLA